MCEIIVRNIKLPYKADKREAISKAEARLKKYGRRALFSEICKRSVDAREKRNILFVYSVYMKLDGALTEKELTELDAVAVVPSEFSPVLGKEKTNLPPCVVGMGPAGLFCALALAEHGYKPIIFEKGYDVWKRKADVSRFFETGELSNDSNVQFGAGGAGTFSDGKLVTRINDPMGKYVLETLVRFGAPEEILWQAKPHVGTDVLLHVVDKMAEYIKSKGGRIYYGSPVKSLRRGQGGSWISLTENGESENSALVLAVGHSARETYEYLVKEGYEVVPKDFSCGVRIEHLAKDIDRAMYGEGDVGILGHGEYTLSHREGNRGVYTFCMCPGGEVVAAASEQGGVVVNGMSNHLRNGTNSNSAVAVSVLKEDYGNHPLKAIEFQRKLERAAYTLGGGNYGAPIQTVGDFFEGRASAEPTTVQPTYMNGRSYKVADLNSGAPAFITSMLKTGIKKFDSRIKGFASKTALLSGYETRTSAPVRILRNDDLTAVGHDNLYPCGEGAGYAGGITSAAIDGLRVAKAIIEKFSPDLIEDK